jgi:hypothetical protein
MANFHFVRVVGLSERRWGRSELPINLAARRDLKVVSCKQPLLNIPSTFLAKTRHHQFQGQIDNMKVTFVATVLALAHLAAAQQASIPACAVCSPPY